MKTKLKNVKAILFDSGDTLNRPKTGNWFIPPCFSEIVDMSKVDFKSLLTRYAMLKARRYLGKNHDIQTEEAELAVFREFYGIFLKTARYPEVNESIVDALARDMVYNDEKFIFFNDVKAAIRRLSAHYKLGIVSLTWPSLERVFRNQGIRDDFKSFIISSKYNQYHSKQQLLGVALKELGVELNKAVFIDDNDVHLKTAKRLGIIPIRINRYGKSNRSKAFDEIASLDELTERLL